MAILFTRMDVEGWGSWREARPWLIRFWSWVAIIIAAVCWDFEIKQVTCEFIIGFSLTALVINSFATCEYLTAWVLISRAYSILGYALFLLKYHDALNRPLLNVLIGLAAMIAIIATALYSATRFLNHAAEDDENGGAL